MRHLILFLFISTAFACGVRGQDQATEFEHLALKGVNADQGEFLRTMIPTLQDCQAVFKGNGANLVWSFSKSMFGEMARDRGTYAEQFVDMRTAHFTSEEALSNREAAKSGMHRIREYLLPGITFYQVTYLQEQGTEFGVTYRYFVKVDDHWVYFPKPWRAFETQD